MKKEQEYKPQKYKKCKYFCYGKYCTYFYTEMKKRYGWEDLTEHECFYTKKYYDEQNGTDLETKNRWCRFFKKKSIFIRLKERFLKKII